MPFYRSVLSRWLVLVAVLALLLGGCSPQAQVEEATPTPIPTPIIPTKPTYKVESGEVVRMLEFTGRLQPVVQKELYFQTGGRIESVLAKKGDVVEEGQVLAKLESGTSSVDIRRAEISLDVAKLNRELFVMEANKFSNDYAIRLKMMDYDIEMAQLALDEINAKVDTSQIKAPFAGTMLAVYITPDNPAEAYKSVMVIADVNDLEVSADLTSTDLQELQEEMDVTVVAVSGPGTELTGKIRRLPFPYGSSDQSEVREEVQDTATRVSLDDDLTAANLVMGDLVRVKVVLERRSDVLWLPPQAIRRFEGRRFVVVQEEEGQRRVDVTIGIASDDRIEITNGLEEGQVVVAP